MTDDIMDILREANGITTATAEDNAAGIIAELAEMDTTVNLDDVVSLCEESATLAEKAATSESIEEKTISQNVVFKAKIMSKRLKNILKAVSGLSDDGRMIISKDKIYLRVVDEPHASVMEFSIFKAAFEEYSVINAGVIAIDLTMIVEFLKLVKKDDIIGLEMMGEGVKDGDKLTLKYGHLSRVCGVIDPTSLPEVKMPDYKYIDNATIPYRILEDVIKQSLDTEADLLSIEIHPREGVSLTSMDDIQSVGMTLPRDEIEANITNGSKMTFALDMLQDLRKASPLLKDAEVKMSMQGIEVLPIKIEAADEGIWEMSYLLAPKILEGDA